MPLPTDPTPSALPTLPADPEPDRGWPISEPARHVDRAHLGQVLAQVLALAASIVAALADGRITAREGRRIARRAVALGFELGQLLDPDTDEDR